MKLTSTTYQTIISMCCLVFSGTVIAQNEVWNNQRQVSIHNKKDTFFLSAFTIVPESFQLTTPPDGEMVSSGEYTVDGSYFIWRNNSAERQRVDSITLQATFRVLPYALGQWQSRFDSLLYRDGSMRVMQPIQTGAYTIAQPLIADQGIQYDGTFSRGLALGNRQDLVLNSNFDLRLSGVLANDIAISAALSDNSIPLQPEGNTQQLQEFDKIFIQLSKGGNRLIGGDYILSRPESHFINYYKRLQGVRFEQETALPSGGRIVSAAGAGSTRGQFARINIIPQEGNQGPYRLRGNNNERFIIILANSERIYIDGKLMVRGLEKDYIIDYNSGEITFTANRIITKDLRIIAEYEYSDQNYNRSIYTFETGYRSDKLDLQFNAYSEQDGILTGGLVDLQSEDKKFLADLGDSTQSAFASSIRLREDGFDPNLVMYRLVDSLGYQDVLVRSTNPELARYTAKFTFVGQGQGNYLPSTSESNGSVFIWVAPDSINGNRQGAYEPISQLIAPKQQQMFSVGGTYRFGTQGAIISEVAVSRNDLNRFSDKDSQDNYGYAITNGLQQSWQLSRQDSASWTLTTALRHEFVSQEFRILKPYRNQEFSRDWNLQDLANGSEHLAEASLTLARGNDLELSYLYNGFFRGDLYDGNKHLLSGRYIRGGLQLNGQINRLTSTSPFFRSAFSRPKLDLSQAFGREKNWAVGFYFEQERNERREGSVDTLGRSSFYYDLGRLYLQTTQGDQMQWRFSYQKRFDYLPQGIDFRQSTEADDFSLNGKWNANSRSVLDATMTIRHLTIQIPSPLAQRGGLNYLGRVQHTLNLLRGGLRSTTSYEISSGQEPKRTFQYLKVNPGQGVYTFIDLNDDGIQQINEFEVAPFPEQAEYIRVTVLTNEFIATNNIIYNQSYALDPSRIKGLRNSFWGKFSDQGTIRIQRKNLQNSTVSLWNPFNFNIADSALVSISSQVRNVFYFNRSNPDYDIQYEWNDFRNRFILTTGYESKHLRRHTLRTRINLNQEIGGLLSLHREDNEQDSEAFDNKDFEILAHSIEPELTWQPSQKFRLQGFYRWALKQNQLPENEVSATFHDLKLEGTYNRITNSSLRTSISLVEIRYDGTANTALEFTMLEGLKKGTNWLWGISFDQRLANNIRLNISYDGRKSGEAAIVHTARAQVSAFF